MKNFYNNLAGLFIGILCFLTFQTQAQLNVNSSVNGTDLATSIVGSGVTVSNVNLRAGSGAAGIFSNGSSTNIGLNEGILLTTGRASDAIGPNNNNGLTHNQPDSYNGDAQLGALVTGSIEDVCSLEFDFVAVDNHIAVQYVFGSEEYNEYVCSSFNDVFGFFVNGVNPAGGNYNDLNVALVPTTSLPVAVNTINNGQKGSQGSSSKCISLTNSAYYIDNAGGTTIQYDGFTTVLTAQIAVVPGETYHFKFAIADVADSNLDSGVFIKGESFSTYECLAGNINFTSPIDNPLCANEAYVNVATNSSFGTYLFILTDASGIIQEFNSNGQFDLTSYALGTYKIYGLSYIGALYGVEEGFNIGDIESIITAGTPVGCFDLSSPLTVNLDSCVETSISIISCAPDVHLECGSNLDDLDLVGVPAIQVEGGEMDDVNFTYIDEVVSSTGCVSVISRTWIITLGDLSETCVHIITLVDTEGPIISGVQEEINIQCVEELPEPDAATATDACGSASPVTVFTSQTGELISTCCLTTANGPGSDWSIWLPVLSEGSCCFNSANWLFEDCGRLDQYADGTAHIHGTVYNGANPSQKFIVNIWLQNKADWATWSAMGRSYRDDLGYAQPNKYIDWSYYELVDGFSTLVGAGDLAGDILFLSHVPTSKYFGWQAGEAANNRNNNNGLSGSFSYTGTLGNSNVCCQNGDFNVDISGCEDNFEQDCTNHTSFTRFYRSVDDCYNATVVEQQINVNDTTAPLFDNCPESITISCEDEIPAVAENVTATDNCIGDVVVQYLGEEEETSNACYRALVRTWSATDECGNRSECVQVITIVDETAPVLHGLPENAELTVECSEVPAAPEVTVTDNCDASVEVNYTEEILEGDCPNNYTIVRTWSAYDNCQNGTSYTQTINVQDTQAPVFDSYEIYSHIECDETPAFLTATDNCGEADVTLIYECYLAGGCLGMYYRIYEAVDECGNVSTAEQYVAIVDNTAPEFQNVPADETIECSEVSLGEDGNYFDGSDVYAIDNCGYHFYLECLLPIDYTYSEEVVPTDDNCPQSFDIVRTWTATDYCDNTATATQVVHVVDTTAPELSVPEDYTASCEDELVYDDASAEDNCGNATISVSVDTLAGNCPNNYTIVRTFVAVDECGNASDAKTQTITVVDETAPSFEEGQLNEYVYECDEEIPVIQPVANDNCSSEVAYSYEDSEDWTEGCYSGFVRTWTATDECGNTSTFNQYIQIQDTTAPVIEGAPELTRPCDDYTDLYVTATDNCNEFDIEIVSEEHVSGSCAGTIIRKYVATDICGNASAEFVQIIHLTDDVAPVIVSQTADFTVECGDEYSVEEPVFSDNCDENMEITSDVSTTTNGCITWVTYEWTATDHCDNSVTATTVVTIEDTTDPVFVEFPESVTINCEDEVPAVVYPVAVDNCDDDVDLIFAEEEVPGECANERVIYRTFRAYDNCGNYIVETQTITIVDNTAPVFSEDNASELVYECDETVPVIQPEAADNCSAELEYSYVDGSEWTEGCYSGFTRTWTVSDDCGNTATFEQYIQIQDTTAPVVDPFVIEISMPCDQIDESILITATDNCNEVIITKEDEYVSGGCAGKLIRTYHIEDACGNVTEGVYQQIITLIDTVAPVVAELPENVTIECGEELPVYTPEWSDNCAEELELSEHSCNTWVDCAKIVTQTWKAVDECGNETVVERTITIVDTTAPYFTYTPEDIALSCTDTIPAAYATAEDVCDEAVVVTHEDEIIAGNCEANYTIVRTYTATDECGNSASYVQNITISDNDAPEFIGDQNSQYSYECNEDAELIQPVAVDNCSEISYSHVDGEVWNDGCSYGFERVWTATDACGNASQFTQYISFHDTTAPVVDPYEMELTMPCDQIDENVLITAQDNCNDVTISYSDEHVSGGCAGKIIRTYHIEDACGNVTEGVYQQIITLIDTVAPVVAELPEDVTIECGEELPSYEPEWSDNCAEELAFSAASSIGQDGCNQIIYQSWTAVDQCGNSTTVGRTITIVDTTAPYFTYTPEDIALSCTDTIPAAYATAEDTCDEEVEITHEDSIVEGNCPSNYTIVRTYTATDACGNSASYVQNITISDNDAPEFIGDQNSQYSYECDEDAELIQPVAVDNCSEISYSHVDGEVWNDGCSYGFERVWTATDACGNAAEFVQYISFHDTTAPVVDDFDIEISMPCDQIEENVLITAQDNCNEVIITFEDEYVSGGCAGKLIRTYHIEDACGNVTEGIYQQIIVLTDNTAPVVAELPEDVTIECGDELPSYEPEWSDNCAEELSLSMASSIGQDGCNEVIYQSWTAMDECGNSTTVGRTITIVDTTAPHFTLVPEDMMLNCDDIIPAADINVVDAEDACSGVTLTYEDEIIEGDCPSNFTIVRTYIATDECGNATTYVQNIVISDNDAPEFGENQDSFTYECADEVPVVQPTATDNCSEISYSFVDGDSWTEGCTSGFERVWTATDACGNVSETFSQYISFIDTTDPVLEGCPEDLVLACDAEIPAPADVTAWDACDDNVEVIFEEYMYGDVPAEGSIADCRLITPARPANNPCVYPYDWAMALFGLPNAHRYYSVSEGNLVQYPNGTIHVTATMNNVLNPANGWFVDVWFENGMDWTAWSSQSFPTSFKADCGAIGANHEEWLYFILQATEGAELVGFGAYTGSHLNLVHAPSNNYFGFQLGDGANNYNAADNGFGGWFSYTGPFMGECINGAGDFAFELDCCPEYWIVRQWTATDCSGNSVTCSQTISFDKSVIGNAGGDMTTIDVPVDEAIGSVNVAPNPAADNTIFTFRTKDSGPTTLEIYDIAGAKIADVYMGTVEAGVEYRVNYNVDALATGVYLYRLSNNNGSEIGRLIINK